MLYFRTVGIPMTCSKQMQSGLMWNLVMILHYLSTRKFEMFSYGFQYEKENGDTEL